MDYNPVGEEFCLIMNIKMKTTAKFCRMCKIIDTMFCTLRKNMD